MTTAMRECVGWDAFVQTGDPRGGWPPVDLFLQRLRGEVMGIERERSVDRSVRSGPVALFKGFVGTVEVLAKGLPLSSWLHGPTVCKSGSGRCRAWRERTSPVVARFWPTYRAEIPSG